jgi:type IV secretion system protein VirB3
MSDTGSVETDPLFVGLTRPTMIFGVSFKMFFLNFFLSMFFYIQSPGLKVIVLAFVLHLVSYILCFQEPLILELYMMKASNFMNCKNKRYFNGANSYDQY